MGKSRTPRETADPSQLLDIGQAAAFLNVSETSLRRWTNSGQLRCLRVGQRRERRFRRGDLLGFLEPSQINGTHVAVTRGSHLCGLYASDSGRITLTIQFLLDGLTEGSVCFLVAPLRIRKQTLESMKKKRASLQTDIDAGRLILSDYHATPRAQVDYFRRRMDEQASEGVQSFRVLGEVWGMRSKASAASLVEYEAAYDRHIARNYPVVTICLYDSRRYSGVEVLNALKGHPDTFRYPLEKTLA